jgi:hypothetical protein
MHADAAYGGYFTLAARSDADARAAFDALSRVDSIAIDPHKHGLQPYGCGCMLFRDPSAGALYKHDSPYTYFSSAELHLGEISLECLARRAVAGPRCGRRSGCFRSSRRRARARLERCRAAALDLFARACAATSAFSPRSTPSSTS